MKIKRKIAQVGVTKILTVMGIMLMSCFVLYSSFVMADLVPGDGVVTNYDGELVYSNESYLWKRTGNTEIYKNPDGTMSRTIGQGIKYLDDKTKRYPKYIPWNSSFFPIINSTYKDYEYQLDTYYSDYEAYFQDNIQAGKGFMFEVDDYWFTYDLSGGKMQWAVEDKGTPDWGKTKSIGSVLSSSPDTYDNIVRYNNSFSQTDVEYEMQLSGVKENFVLNSYPDGAGDYLYLEYTGELQFDTNLTIWANGEIQTSKEFTTSGAIEFKDENNLTVFQMPTPIATDSNDSLVNLIYDIKPNAEKLVFGLKTPVSFLESAVYPVFIDPTITLQDADTENLDDAITYLYATGGPREASIFLKFNINYFEKPYFINQSKLCLYAYFVDSNSDGDVIVKGIDNQTWDEEDTYSQLNSMTFTNSSIQSAWSSTGFDCVDVKDIVDYYLNKNNENVSFYLVDPDYNDTAGHNRDSGTGFFQIGEDTIAADIRFYDKEDVNISLRPYLNITYTPYIDILSPSPSQTFTQDAPTAHLNISTATPMDICYWTNNSGTTNYTMDSINSTYWYKNDAGATLLDGSHTVEFYCNQSSDGTWRTSESVSFDVDSVNVTTCRDLTVSRTYELRNNIANSDAENCIVTASDDIVFNCNSKIIDGLDTVSTTGIISRDDNFTINNCILTDWFRGIDSGYNSDFKIYDASISSSQYGILSLYSHGALIYDSDVSVSNNGIEISGSNYSIYDSTFSGNSAVRVLGSGGDNNSLINCSYSSESFQGTTAITRKWYIETTINNSVGNLESVQIDIYDKDSNLEFSKLTNSSGQIERLEVIEYVNNGTKVYSTPHIINISKATYTTNSTTYNLTISQNVNHIVTLEISNQAPTSTLISPTNDTWTTSLTNTMTCNQSDTDGNLKNVTIYTWLSGVEETKNTKSITGSTNSSEWTNLGFTSQGTYEWNCYTCDDDDSCAFATSNFTLGIDSTSPLIEYISPTKETNENVSASNIFINLSWTEANFQNITSRLYNSTGLYDSTTNTNEITTINYTGLIDGVYTYNVTITDKAGNSNSTETRSITLDDTSPVVDITYPIDSASYGNGTDFQINYTVSDNLIGLDDCWYTNDSGVTNHTITCGVNITQTFTIDDTYTYTIYSNDTLNNIGSDEVTFTISSTSPAITLEHPINNQFLDSADVIFNVTALDGDGVDVCQLWGNWSGWHLNQTLDVTTGVEANFSQISINEGEYIWNIWCNDSLGNGDFSPANFSFTIDTISPLTLNSSFTPTIVYNTLNASLFGNITDNNLDTIWLQINHSGTYQNITITDKVGNQYNYTLLSSLISNQENITWKWWANDSAGNENSSELDGFTVTNRQPTGFSINPSNDSYTNSIWFYLNATSTDADDDTLNYSFYYANASKSFLFMNWTTSLDYFNLTGYNTTEGATNYFYINLSDGIGITQKSDEYLFTIDTTNPSLDLDYPRASPIYQCSMTDIVLNYTANDTNLDYCSFNVTFAGETSTANTIISDCSNSTFNVSYDDSVQVLKIRAYDKAGNYDEVTRLIYVDTDNSGCAAPSTPSPTGGGGGTTIIEANLTGYQLGDGICEDEKGETFFNSPDDCAQEFYFPNLDEALFFCIDDDESTECVWSTNPGLFIVLFFMLGVLMISILFEFKPEAKGIKKWTFKPKKKFKGWKR